MSDPPPSLNANQKQIWLRLQNATYTKDDKPSQTMVTQIFKKAFTDLPEEQFRNDLQYFFAYQKIKDNKDLKTIKYDLISKIRGKPEKARLRSYLGEDKMEMLKDEVADLEARSMEYAAAGADDEEEQPQPQPPAESAAARAARLVAPAPAPAAPAGMTAEDYAVMQQMADMRAENRAEEKNMEDSEGNITLSSMLSRYIDTNSQVYKDNKKEINEILKIFSNPKNINDGSWITKLADKEFPGVAVFQEVVKAVGLGFSEEDDADFLKMLSRDPDDRKSISNERFLSLFFKMAVNPDKMGKAINVRLSQAGDDIAAWWKKVKGERADLPPKDEAVREKIDERKKANEKSRIRERGIDDWMGIDRTPPPTGQSGHAGSADGKIAPGGRRGPTDEEVDNTMVVPGTGGEYDPNTLSYKEAYEILLPPDMSQYGYEDTTAAQDLGKWALDFITSDATSSIGNGDRKTFLDKLKKEHPDKYAEYEERFAKYKKVVQKASQDRDEPIDYNISKDYVDASRLLTEDLIKKAIASGKIDRAGAEKLYDGWDLMNGIADGTAKMTYADVEELQSRLLNALPREILTENSDMIQEFMTAHAEELSANWDGDSDLGNFDWLKDILNPPDEETNADGTPKEKKIPKWKPTADQAEVKYRYRGRWGDTDKVFEKMADDVEKRNLVIEVQRLRESVDTTNKLVQSQLLTDRMRFDNTFRMPDAPPSTYYPLPDKFKRDHRAIFTPAVIQNSMRDFERNTRDEAYYGQYQGFSPAVMPTSARQDLLTNPLVYPSNADLATGGELPEVGKPTLFDLIKQTRF